MYHKPYTKKDTRFIVDNYESLTDIQIAKRLNRTPKGILHYRERLGLYKLDVLNINRLMQYNLNRSRLFEMNALLNYISMGKGGDVAKIRYNELLSTLEHKPVFYRKKRKVKKRVIANIWQMYINGMNGIEIAGETGHVKQSIYKWIREVSPYTGDNKLVITLESKINY